jgi:hypothetical protein
MNIHETYGHKKTLAVWQELFDYYKSAGSISFYRGE